MQLSSNPEQDGYNITGPLEEIELESRFVSSTEVVCGPPSQDRPYLISVSNVNSTTLRSNPLLWVPYDPACYNCSAKDQYCFMKVSQAIWRNVESFMLMEEGGRGVNFCRFHGYFYTVPLIHKSTFPLN